MIKKGHIVLLLVMVLVVSLIGCNNVKEDAVGETEEAPPVVDLASIKVTLETAAQPIETGVMTPYVVSLADEQGNPVEVDSVHFYMNMEMMNHPTQGTMQKMENGKYEVELPLAMEGEWYTIITITKGEESTEMKEFKVQATGEKFMEYMKGYDADQPDAEQGKMHN